MWRSVFVGVGPQLTIRGVLLCGLGRRRARRRVMACLVPDRGVRPVVLLRPEAHLVRSRFRHLPAQRRRQALAVVGVDPGIVPAT